MIDVNLFDIDIDNIIKALSKFSFQLEVSFYELLIKII